MKKELKQLIKDKKYSDEQILQILQSHAESENEKDVKDEADESEDQTDSEESDTAEKTPAVKETPKKGISPVDLAKMIADAVKTAFVAEKESQLMPAQKALPEPPKVKKTEPKPKTQTSSESIIDSNGQLVF